MFAITKSGVSDNDVYLGMCRELTDTYSARGNLLSRYRIALLCLLSAGGVSIYFLSRYITRPIRSLGRLASRIADGDYTLRSRTKAAMRSEHWPGTSTAWPTAWWRRCR